MSYSQNSEDDFILNLFDTEIAKYYGKDFVGNVLELGSND